MTHWLFESIQNMQEPPEAFLSAAESDKYSALRFEKRRTEWLLGRWTAKRLLQAWVLRRTHEIIARTAFEILNDADGAPHAHDLRDLQDAANSDLQGLTLSISHSHEHALCATACGKIAQGALGKGLAVNLGADLEWVEPREGSFVGDYFTANEQARVQTSSPPHRDLVVTAIWSAKEATLKALHKGLSVDTRAIEISIAPFAQLPDQWTPFEISALVDQPASFHGWWRVQEGFVLSLVTDSDDVPEASPLTPETVLVTSGAFHEGHGILHQRIAHATRHHARHTQGH